MMQTKGQSKANKPGNGLSEWLFHMCILHAALEMLDGLLDKVRRIHEDLGGDREEGLQAAAAKGDKFAELRIQTEVKLHETTCLQDERDKLLSLRSAYSPLSDSPDVLKLKYRIRSCLHELTDMQVHLEQALLKQCSKPQARSI